MNKLVIAIDGPASSGKSTIAKLLAEEFNSIYIDTGAMYRAVTLALLESDKFSYLEDDIALQNFLNTLTFEFIGKPTEQELLLNGENVSEKIRSKEVTENVSEVSAKALVRKHLVYEQRKMAKKQGVVMDGRDIGTVVLPDADYKFFLTAKPEVRAKRRLEENIAKGYSKESYEDLLQAIIKRDEYDTNREVDPLRAAEDAITIDTSQLNIEEVLQKIKNIMKNTKENK